MSLINGRVVGLIYEFYPVILVGCGHNSDGSQGEDMLESFVPISRGQETPVDWADMNMALMARGYINEGSIGRMIKEDDMKKFIEELQLEPGLLEEEARKEGGRFVGLIHAFDGMKVKFRGDDNPEMWAVPTSPYWAHLPNSKLHYKRTEAPDTTRDKFFNWRVYLKVGDKRQTYGDRDDDE